MLATFMRSIARPSRTAPTVVLAPAGALLAATESSGLPAKVTSIASTETENALPAPEARETDPRNRGASGEAACARRRTASMVATNALLRLQSAARRVSVHKVGGSFTCSCA